MSQVKFEDFVSSKEWLKEYGLKPQKLQFYDAFADSAFRHSDGVVDIKTKPEDKSGQTNAESNIKHINAKYCEQFVHTRWKDDSVVHLYITKEKWKWYEKRMKTILENMESRIKWLQQGSRELFGTILEAQVYILIDTSHSMKDKLNLVKEKIFQLMQEQLSHKHMFNIVKFDSKVEAWKLKLAEVNEENLKEAWFWVQEIKVGSSTNTLGALQLALSDKNTEAVYLLTDGRPDQPSETILSQIHFKKAIPIHTISFNCDDVEANCFLHQISSQTAGRFHCYSSYLQDPKAPQPFVSEDILLLQNEIKQGKSDLQQVQKLYTDCLMLDWYHNWDNKLHISLHSRPLSQSDHNLINRPDRLLKTKKARNATTGQTKSGLLRARSHSASLWKDTSQANMSLETREQFLSKNMKDIFIQKEIKGTERQKSQKKVKRSPKDCLDLSSSRWLKTHGLAAMRLTIMDALEPTSIPHTAKYVPILDKHVFSKVFDEVLPLAQISRDGKFSLINPQAVNLTEYRQKLTKAIENYERRLNLVIWRALSQEERDKFQSEVPVSYEENKEALLQALDRLGWPISVKNVTLLEDEINAGKLYLQKAHVLQEATQIEACAAKTRQIEEEKEKNPQNPQKTKKKMDTLRGQKVIARSEIDGFYYPGVVVRRISSKTFLVDFCNGDNQIISISFIIQIGGAVPCPLLKVGDFVFSKTGEGSGCYVPAVVIATPRTGAEDKFYTVLKYNNRKEHCLRRELIKISQSQFTFSSRYIRKAQMVDYTIPNVQFVKPLLKPQTTQEGKKRRMGKERGMKDKLTKSETEEANGRIHSVISHGSKNGSSGDSDSEVQDDLFGPDEAGSVTSQRLYSPLPLNSTPPLLHSTPKTDYAFSKVSTPRSLVSSNGIKYSSANDIKKLENLILQITQYQQKQREQQQSVQEHLHKLTVLKAHEEKCGLEEEQSDLAKKQIDLLQQLRILIPVNNIQQTKSDPTLNPQNKDKPYNGLLVPGQKVLAICSYSGWYKEGIIKHDCGDSSYFIQRSSGEIVRIMREEMFTETDDYGKEIKKNDPVIGPNPLHERHYCPGIVIKVMPDLKLVIQYYDKNEELVPREKVYLTSPERFARDSAYILECEERWVGQPVIARNDLTGTFHLAEVKKCIGNGKQYILSWENGKTARQDIEWIFGKFSQPHILKIGAHILTLATPSSLTFLPGTITGHNGAQLKVTFCNGERCQNVEPPHCFGLSDKKFTMAVNFFHQQNHERDDRENDINSEKLDSLSEISSVTITSNDSDSEMTD
ncbi:hypothetical protein GDO86_004097 [Hymenochirus boettgeri]|uniref:VWFA domain-containing protein n=1 Tax=Hymenochirus boettgeri TaxID=247094 RepID=A0A8T2K959_9PIPI|nr:hypothetical protein GDO86_004097 [Hymenochirus boettgeri]